MAQQFDRAVVWGGSQDDNATRIIQDASGDFYVLGSYSGNSDFPLGVLQGYGFQDVFVLKIGDDGNTIWQIGIGGSGTDQASAIAFDENGDILVGGRFQGSIDLDPGSGESFLTSNPSGALDGFIARYSATDGSFMQQFDITSGGTIDIKSMQSAENGDVYIAGQFAQTVDLDFGSGTRQAISNVNSGDAFVGRYTSDLDLIWVNPIGSMTPAIDYFSDVKVSPDGGVYVTGLLGGLADIDPGTGQTNLNAAIDAVLIRYRVADGGLDWGFLLGGNSVDLGVSLMLTEEMDIIVTGSMNSSSFDADPGPAVVDINKTGSVATPFVLRYSSTATYINGFSFDASNVSSLNVNRMIPSYGGTIIVLGNFTGSFDINPGAPTSTLQSQDGSPDAFFIQYEPDWSPSRHVQLSGAGTENLNDAIVSGIYLYGVAQFENQCFPVSGSSEIVSSVSDGLDAAFMAWNTNPEVLENTPAHNQQLLVYPNPAENSVIIEGCLPGEQVIITDITGRAMHPAMAGNKADVSKLANGVYTIHVLRTDGKLSTFKLLIQNK